MIPIRLTLSGFLSYRDEVDIDFTSFDLACISGPNGSGKSSLLDAITWSLFGQARTRDDAVINLQAESAEVTLEFEYESNRYRVRRAKSPGKTTLVEFHILGPEGNWKPLTERTLRATEARITEILRLDYETFVNAAFFLQGKADQFTQQRPADRKRILSNILGLEIWEIYRKTTVAERKKIETSITALDGRLHEINTELAEEDQRRARLEEIETNMAALTSALEVQTALLDQTRQQAAMLEERRQLAETLQAQAASTQEEINTLEARLTDRMAEKQSYADLMSAQEEIEQQHQEWVQAKEDLAAWSETAERFNEHEKRRHAPLTEIEAARARLETEVEALQNQAGEIEEQVLELASRQEALKPAKDQVAGLDQKVRRREELEADHQTLLQQQAEAKAENPRLRTEMEEIKERIEKLEASTDALCPLCGQPLEPADRDRLIAELTEEGTARGDRFRANQELLKSFSDQVNEIKAQIQAFDGLDDELRQATRTLDQTESQIQALSEAIEGWQKDGKARLKELQEQIKNGDFAKEARQTLAGIDKELKEIGYDAAAHDTARRKETDLQEAGERRQKLENARAALQPLEREIKEVGEQIRRAQENLGAQQAEADKAAAQLEAEGDAPDVITAEQKMLELKEQENQSRMLLGAAQQNLAVLDTLKERKISLEAEREDLSRSVVEHKALERAFGKNGVPAMLIEQALPQIETKANEVLEKLSGGGMHISIITQQEYKDSKREDLRETLEIQISDINGARDYELFSGGEAFRINFAIRLALSEVLAQRAGARLQTLVIDEGFGSQDEVGRQRLVEAINLVRPDFSKILVITHIESLKEAFPARLEITKGPRGSMVEVI